MVPTSSVKSNSDSNINIATACHNSIIIQNQNINNPTEEEKINLPEIIGISENVLESVKCISRDEEIQNICDKLENEFNRIAITGLGGVGKTTLSISIAKKLRTNRKLKYIIFLRCENNDTFQDSLKNTLSLLNIETDSDLISKFNAMCTKLNDYETLFIYDNVDNFSVIWDYLPSNERTKFKIIITSQNNIWNDDSIHVYRLKMLNDSMTKDFLLNKLEKLKNKITDNNIEKMVQACKGYILLLTLMTSSIISELNRKLNNLTINQIIENYIEDLQEKIKIIPSQNIPINYELSVQAAILINFEKVEIACDYDSIRDYKNIILKLKNIFSCCNPGGLDINSINKYFKHDNIHNIESVLEKFCQYSILNTYKIKYNSDSLQYGYVMSIHRITQSVLCNSYEPEDIINILYEWMKFKESRYDCMVLKNYDKYKQIITTCPPKNWMRFCKILLGGPYRHYCMLFIVKILEIYYLDEEIQKYINMFFLQLDLIGNLYIYKKFVQNSEVLKKLFEKFIENRNSSIKEWDEEIDKLNKCTAVQVYFEMFYNVHNWTIVQWLSWWNKIHKLNRISNEHLTLNINGWTIFHIAAMNDNVNLFFKLGNNSIINTQTKKGITPMHIAAACGSKAVIKHILELKTDLSIKDYDQNNILHYAVRSGLVKIVEIFLDINNLTKSIHERNKFDQTVLHMAAKLGYTKVVEFLINTDIDINLKDRRGKSALYEAVSNGHIEVVKLLMKKNIDIISKKDDMEFGYPINQWRKKRGFVEILKNKTNNAINSYLIIKHVETQKHLKFNFMNDIDFYTDSSLHLAVKKGLRDIVEILINKDINIINEKDEHGNTSLHLAVENGLTDIVETLINKDINVINEKDENGNTSLHLAIEKGFTDIVEILIKKDINIINERDGYSNTSLHLAVEKGLIEIVELLINKDINIINEKDGYGNTSLYLAVQKGLTKIVEILINKDKNIINEKDENGNTSLHLAVENGNIEIVEILVNKDINSINEKNKYGNTSFHIAVNKGFIKIVEILINKNFNIIYEKYKYSNTTLHLAVKKGLTEIVEILTNKDINIINEKDGRGCTSLHLAVDKGLSELVKILINKDINIINEKDVYGNTSLHLAVKKNLTEIVEILINNDINMINEKNKFGSTSLHLAVENGNTEIVEMLINNNINIEEKNKYGNTSLELAIMYDFTKIVKILQNKYINIYYEKYGIKGIIQGIPINQYDITNIVKDETSLQLTVEEECPDIIGTSKNKYNNVNKESNYCGCKSLHLAVENGNTEIAGILIKKDINIIYDKDEDGNTSLHLAVKYRHLEIIEILVNKDINIISKKDKFGNTGLHLAAMNGFVEIVEFFINKNININTENEEGNTAIFYAENRGHTDIVKMLTCKYNEQNKDSATNLPIKKDNLTDTIKLRNYKLLNIVIFFIGLLFGIYICISQYGIYIEQCYYTFFILCSFFILNLLFIK